MLNEEGLSEPKKLCVVPPFWPNHVARLCLLPVRKCASTGDLAGSIWGILSKSEHGSSLVVGAVMTLVQLHQRPGL